MRDWKLRNQNAQLQIQDWKMREKGAPEWDGFDAFWGHF